MKSHELTFSVPNPVGDGAVELAASLHLPDRLADGFRLLVCAPDGSYTRTYWHLPALAAGGYSFASHLTAAGYGVLALDTLGTGESSRPENGDDLTLEKLAEANASAAREIREQLASGALAAELPPQPGASCIGLGHSLGGAILIMQQSLFGSFDAIGVLGFTNLHLETMYVPHEREAELTPEERRDWAREHIPLRSWNRSWDELEPYFEIPRENLRAWFHMPDVPPDVVAAEEAEATVIPRSVALQSIIPRCTTPYAATIASPVFLAFGEQDVSPDPHAEVPTYPASRDVSLFVLPASGHCHNYASTRVALWDKLAGWGRGVGRG